MVYAVVQFVSWGRGNSVLTIPEIWIFAKEKETWCFFPKFNQQQNIKDIAKSKGDWKQYWIKRLSQEPIKTYEKALEKESEARFTSGIDTDCDSECKKSNQELKTPDFLKKKGCMTYRSFPDHQSVLHQLNCNHESASTPLNAYLLNSGHTPRSGLRKGVDEAQVNNDFESVSTPLSAGLLNSGHTNGFTNPGCSHNEKLDIDLVKITELQKMIQQHVIKQSTYEDVDLDDFGVPLNSENELRLFEDKLVDRQLRMRLRKLLSQLGGKVLAKGTKKMCEMVITCRLASEYTLFGKKKNRGNFSKLRLYRIMQQACLRAFPSTTVSEIDVCIGSFLRHAPDRPGGLKYQAPERSSDLQDNDIELDDQR